MLLGDWNLPHMSQLWGKLNTRLRHNAFVCNIQTNDINQSATHHGTQNYQSYSTHGESRVPGCLANAYPKVQVISTIETRFRSFYSNIIYIQS